MPIGGTISGGVAGASAGGAIGAIGGGLAGNAAGNAFAQKTNVIHRQAHSVMSTILATNTKGWIPITIYGK